MVIVRGYLLWEIILYSLVYIPIILYIALYYIPYYIILLYYIPCIILCGYYIISYSSFMVSLLDCVEDLSNLFTIDLLLTLYIINTHRWYAHLHSPPRH